MKLNKAQKRKVIAKLMRTASGRIQIAAAMQEPLREYRDYVSVGRRAFMVDELEDGALPYYDKDADVVAYVIGEEGQDVMSVVKGERVFVPMFEIATNPTIPFTKIRERKYDVENRVKVKAKSEVFRVEDEKIFDMFSTIVNDVDAENELVTESEANVSIDDFSSAIGEVEQWGDVRCAMIFMNPANMKIVRKIGKDYFDPITSNEVLRTGWMGSLFGAQIHTSGTIAKDEIYFTAEPEFFGVLAVGIDLTILSADEPSKRQIGFSVFEQIGFLVSNRNGIAGLKIT